MLPFIAISVALAADPAPTPEPPPGPSGPPRNDTDALLRRVAEGRDLKDRCAALPLTLAEAPHERIDLDADGWMDRLVLLPGSCERVTCTWRIYRQCPGGGHRNLIEIMALELTAQPTDDHAWLDFIARVPAPANEPQAWRLRYQDGHYVRAAPVPARD